MMLALAATAAAATTTWTGAYTLPRGAEAVQISIVQHGAAAIVA